MPHPLTIHLPAPIQPFERDDRFHDPLDKALRSNGRLGKCTGGGTAMDANFEVTGCDVEVEVKDLAKALPVIRDTLAQADPPAGTTVTDVDSGKVVLRFSKTGAREYPLPKPTTKKRFLDSKPFGKPGEVFAYRLTRDRYVLLHLYGHGGIGSVVWVPEWCGAAVPPADEIRQLVRRQPEHYRLGLVMEAWRQKETDRDDRRLVRTGVTIPPPKNGVRGWFPGSTDIYLWPLFERVLKEFFGLVRVSPAVRLSHDLGLERSVAHFAIWPAAGPVTRDSAKRLFYGCGSGYRRTHPDRKRPAPTNALKKAIAGLKEAFPNGKVWAGDFSAHEGFVIVSVKRKHFPAAWSAASRLARDHGLACYDPEADRVVLRRG